MAKSESAPSLEQTPTLKIQKFNEHPSIYLNKYGIQYQMTISLPWNPQHIGLVVSRFDLTLLNEMLF